MLRRKRGMAPQTIASAAHPTSFGTCACAPCSSLRFHRCHNIVVHSPPCCCRLLLFSQQLYCGLTLPSPTRASICKASTTSVCSRVAMGTQRCNVMNAPPSLRFPSRKHATSTKVAVFEGAPRGASCGTSTHAAAVRPGRARACQHVGVARSTATLGAAPEVFGETGAPRTRGMQHQSDSWRLMPCLLDVYLSCSLPAPLAIVWHPEYAANRPKV